MKRSKSLKRVCTPKRDSLRRECAILRQHALFEDALKDNPHHMKMKPPNPFDTVLRDVESYLRSKLSSNAKAKKLIQDSKMRKGFREAIKITKQEREFFKQLLKQDGHSLRSQFEEFEMSKYYVNSEASNLEDIASEAFLRIREEKCKKEKLPLKEDRAKTMKEEDSDVNEVLTCARLLAEMNVIYEMGMGVLDGRLRSQWIFSREGVWGIEKRHPKSVSEAHINSSSSSSSSPSRIQPFISVLSASFFGKASEEDRCRNPNIVDRSSKPKLGKDDFSVLHPLLLDLYIKQLCYELLMSGKLSSIQKSVY